ncbi:7483_t:CDS:2, partial [Scutellospora calospora]
MRRKLIDIFNHWLKVSKDKLSAIINIVEMLYTASLLIYDVEDNTILRHSIPDHTSWADELDSRDREKAIQIRDREENDSEKDSIENSNNTQAKSTEEISEILLVNSHTNLSNLQDTIESESNANITQINTDESPAKESNELQTLLNEEKVTQVKRSESTTQATYGASASENSKTEVEVNSMTELAMHSEEVDIESQEESEDGDDSFIEIKKGYEFTVSGVSEFLRCTLVHP